MIYKILNLISKAISPFSFKALSGKMDKFIKGEKHEPRAENSLQQRL